MSCAALSIRAVRMAERGMETCSEMEESGGLILSAAADDKGQSSRQRATMESTITYNRRQWSVNKSLVRNHGGFWVYLELLVRSFSELTSQWVQSLSHRPIYREDVSQLAKRRVQLKGEKSYRVQISVCQQCNYCPHMFHIHSQHGSSWLLSQLV